MKIHYFFVAARRGNAPTVSVLRVCVSRVTKRLPVPYRRHIIIKYHYYYNIISKITDNTTRRESGSGIL